MQTNKVQGVATSVWTDEGRTYVRYHSTNVVEFDRDTVTLRSGGWETVTTKRRMNQASEQFNLGYSVYQKKHQWFVRWYALGSGWVSTPFKDGMQIPRRAKYWDAARGEWIASGSDA